MGRFLGSEWPDFVHPEKYISHSFQIDQADSFPIDYRLLNKH